MKLEINLSNKVFFTLIAIVILVVVAVLAFGGNTFTTSQAWHPLQQISTTVGSGASVDQWSTTDNGVSGSGIPDGIIDHANYADVAGKANELTNLVFKDTSSLQDQSDSGDTKGCELKTESISILGIHTGNDQWETCKTGWYMAGLSTPGVFQDQIYFLCCPFPGVP